MDVNEKIFALFNESDLSWNEVADEVNSQFELNLTRDAVRKRYYRQNKSKEDVAPESIDIPKLPDSLVVESKSSKRIKTLDDLLESNGVDLEVWDVVTHKTNTWEVGTKNEFDEVDYHTLYANRAVLQKRKDTFIESKLLDVLGEIKSHSRYVSKATYSPKGEHLFIPCLFDVHIGKPSDEDVEVLYADVISRLIKKVTMAGYKIDKVVFPVGNDLLNFDNLNRTTTAGTLVSSSLSMYEAIDIACKVIVSAVEQLEIVAPVEIVMIGGNHDREATYWLGKVLEAYFTKNKNVSIDASSDTRKYVLWHNVLIGMAHGSDEKKKDMASLMAVERPQLWGESTHREWLTGHLHQKAMSYQLITESHGVVTRIIPALCDSDDWHKLKGYVGNKRAAEAYIWSEDGFEDQLGVNIN